MAASGISSQGHEQFADELFECAWSFYEFGT